MSLPGKLSEKVAPFLATPLPSTQYKTNSKELDRVVPVDPDNQLRKGNDSCSKGEDVPLISTRGCKRTFPELGVTDASSPKRDCQEDVRSKTRSEPDLVIDCGLDWRFIDHEEEVGASSFCAIAKLDKKTNDSVNTAILPGWRKSVLKEGGLESMSEFDALIDSFIYFSASREKARYKKERIKIPPELDKSALNDSIVWGQADGRGCVKFCNIHREDDRQSKAIFMWARQHSFYKRYERGDPKITDAEFVDFMQSLTIARLFNSESTINKLGQLTKENVDSAYARYKANSSNYPRSNAYQLNPAYGKFGMNMRQFIFELIPDVFSDFTLFTNPPHLIDEVAKGLNAQLQKKMVEWVQKQPQPFTHKVKSQKKAKGASEKHSEITYEYKVDDDTVCRKVHGGGDAFKNLDEKSLNYTFNFAQALADIAYLCPELISLDSPMVIGIGARKAVDSFLRNDKTGAEYSTLVKALQEEIKPSWPSVLGPFNLITLEQSLCEWNHWLSLNQDSNKKRKLYKPASSQ